MNRYGTTLNGTLLLSVSPGVVTSIAPLAAPVGITAAM
jgi:hypothetical protein